MSLPKRLGFERVRADVDGHPRWVARFTCARCKATIDVAIKNGNALSPDHVAKIVARDHGWHADPENRRFTRCPACQSGGPRPRERDLLTPPDAEPTEETMQPQKVTPIKPATVTALTSEKRVAIRNFLDKCFDDSVGFYLDNMSDQRIADALDIPRIHVETVRDAAYGPIRADPLIVKMLADVSVLRRDLEEQQAQLTLAQQRVAAMEAELGKLTAPAP